jgi:vacuolar-type H+-ATPase subunit E/Vma4
MALADLILALERDAGKQAAARVEEARSRAAAVREQADREVSARRRSVLGGEETRLRNAAAREVAEARRHARRAILETRQDVIDRIFSEAAARLHEDSALESYRQTLAAHLHEVLTYIGSRPASIVCPPSLEESVRDLLRDRPHIRVRSDSAAEPGIVAVTDDGALTVDNTLTARLQRLRPVLESELVKRLDTLL